MGEGRKLSKGVTWGKTLTMKFSLIPKGRTGVKIMPQNRPNLRQASWAGVTHREQALAKGRRKGCKAPRPAGSPACGQHHSGSIQHPHSIAAWPGVCGVTFLNISLNELQYE